MELRRVRTGLVRATAGLFGVLAATGVWLSFNYQPDVSAGVTQSSVMSGVHRWASSVVLVVLLALLVVGIAEVVQRQASARGWAAAGALLLLAVALSVSGYMIRWDQLALDVVELGTRMKGLFTVFRDDVRFVIVDGIEVRTGSVRLTFILHALVLPLVFAVTLWWGRARKTATSVGDLADTLSPGA